jgi:hypothetical protein
MRVGQKNKRCCQGDVEIDPDEKFNASGSLIRHRRLRDIISWWGSSGFIAPSCSCGIRTAGLPMFSSNQPARLIPLAQGGGDAMHRRNPGLAISKEEVRPEGTVRYGCSEDLKGPFRTDVSTMGC